jgi:hypothetical protein
MPLTYTEFTEILRKKPENRYKYFVKRAVAEEEVFGLFDDEGWLMLEQDDKDVMLLFPDLEFAEYFRKEGGFDDFRVENLDLIELMEWLDDFKNEDLMVAVFPTPDFQSVVIQPETLKTDIQELLDREEGEE